MRRASTPQSNLPHWHSPPSPKFPKNNHKPHLKKEQSVKIYESPNIRNIAVVGHAHAGKTSLVSAMLFTSGATPRLGRVDDGSAVTDYDEESVARQMTLSTNVAFAEWTKGND